MARGMGCRLEAADAGGAHLTLGTQVPKGVAVFDEYPAGEELVFALHCHVEYREASSRIEGREHTRIRNTASWRSD